MGKKSRRFGTLVLVTIMMMMIAFPNVYVNGYELTDEIEDLTGFKVAVYFGTELDTVVASRIALVNMYEWMNATVDILNATDIKNGALDGYEILAMPGGNPTTYSADLGMDGMLKIREYVSSGGSYFGICGGAMLAVRLTAFGGATSYYQLKLYNGTVKGPITEIDGMTSLSIVTNSTGPDLSGLPSTCNSLYLGGGYYLADEGQDMLPFATYDVNGHAALIGSTYGHGSVCLSATHPEFEENGDRDGTDYLDSIYDDPDSEWDLMYKISLWQIETSTWVVTNDTTTETTTSTTTTNDTIPDNPMPLELMVIAGAGVIVVAIAALVIFKKR